MGDSRLITTDWQLSSMADIGGLLEELNRHLESERGMESLEDFLVPEERGGQLDE